MFTGALGANLLPGAKAEKGWVRDYSSQAAFKIWNPVFSVADDTGRDGVVKILFGGVRNGGAVPTDGTVDHTGTVATNVVTTFPNNGTPLIFLGRCIRALASQDDNLRAYTFTRYNTAAYALTDYPPPNESGSKKQITRFKRYCDALAANFKVNPEAVWNVFWELVIAGWYVQPLATKNFLSSAGGIAGSQLINWIEQNLMTSVHEVPFNSQNDYSNFEWNDGHKRKVGKKQKKGRKKNKRSRYY